MSFAWSRLFISRENMNPSNYPSVSWTACTMTAFRVPAMHNLFVCTLRSPCPPPVDLPLAKPASTPTLQIWLGRPRVTSHAFVHKACNFRFAPSRCLGTTGHTVDATAASQSTGSRMVARICGAMSSGIGSENCVHVHWKKGCSTVTRGLLSMHKKVLCKVWPYAIRTMSCLCSLSMSALFQTYTPCTKR